MIYTYTTTKTIDNEIIEDIIDTAGWGIGYWAHSAVVDDANETYTLTWNGSDFTDGERGSEGKKTLTYEDIAVALVEVSRGEFATSSSIERHAQDVLNCSQTSDSDLGDVVIQIALFGELIYG